MKEIETSKGRFVVCDKSELNWKDRFYINNRIKESCQVLKLNEYESYEITGKKANAKDDLFRLLESQGVEITNNTYIFKV